VVFAILNAKKRYPMKLTRNLIRKIIKEELTHVLKLREGNEGPQFEDDQGDLWNIDCKTQYAMSCDPRQCLTQPFAKFSSDDQAKLSSMCKVNESSKKITRAQLRNMLREVAEEGSEKLVNHSVEQTIKQKRSGVTYKSEDVINFFNHLGSHGKLGWGAKDLQAAVQNIRTNTKIENSVPFEYIWKLTQQDHEEAKRIEDGLKSAKDFHALNRVILGMASDAMYWKGNGKPPPDEKSRNDQRKAVGLPPVKITENKSQKKLRQRRRRRSGG